MGNLLVLTLCTQGLNRLHGQFVGTHIVHIEPTWFAWAICWYQHCAHRTYIGCMGNLLVPTLCTQGLHRLHGQFVGTHIVNIGATQVAWAICWYSHCAHRAYIVCMGNLLVPTLCTQGLHSLHGQFVGTHIVYIGPTQVAWAICWYPHCAHCAHRAYIGCMGNLLVPTLCTQGLHRLHGQFVGTHIVNIGATQVAWAICWYPHCAHRAYIGCMGNSLVPTLCTQNLHRLHGQFVGTHIVNIEATQVAWAICWYSHCAHRAYMVCMGNSLVPTFCTQNLHRLHGQFVGTNIVAYIGCNNLLVLHCEHRGYIAWAICWYPHCAHRAYIGCMGNLLVPTLCTQGLHRLHGQFVGTHIVNLGATQVAWAICWYSHCAHRGLHSLHGQFVGIHIVHIGPTQVAWAICWYPHCEHTQVGTICWYTLCTYGLHRLHGQFVGTHIVHIGPTQVAWAICWYFTLCTQGLHRLHGQFVGTHIVHIEPTQVAWAICWYPHCDIGPTQVAWAICWYPHCEHRLHGQFVGTHIVHIGPTQVAWAICWYPHCEHRAQGLHRLFGQFVGTHIVHIWPTQVAWAICWYSHCAHRAYIGCMGNLLVLTLYTYRLHRLHGQFVGTHIVYIEPTQVAWAICWYPHCAHRAYIGCMGNLLVPTLCTLCMGIVAYIGCMGNLLVPTLCTQGLHRLHGQFVGTHIVNIGATQVAWAICWYSHCAHRAYIVCMGNLLVPTLCTQSLHRLHGQFVGTHIVNIGLHRWHGQFVGTHIVHIGPTQVAWAICWYPHCAHRAYIGCMGNLLVPHCAHRAYIGCMGNLLVPTL